VAHDESLRLLEAQREGLERRTYPLGTLLAAAVIVTTFLGGKALAPVVDL
jgi:hypothetical protein